MKLRHSHRFAWVKNHRRGVFIGGSVLLVVLGTVGYVVWSMQVWSQYQPSYTQWQQTVLADIEKAITLPTATPEDRTQALHGLDGITKRINDTQQSICETNVLIGWQAAYIDGPKSAQAACQTVVTRVNEFKTQLQKSIDYLNDDQSLAKIIASIALPDELAEDQWEAQIAVWEAARKAIADMTVGEEFSPVQAAALGKVTAVKQAWQEVAAAHEAKDKERFIASKATLAEAYDGLNDVAAESSERLKVLAASLQQRYEKAFMIN